MLIGIDGTLADLADERPSNVTHLLRHYDGDTHYVEGPGGRGGRLRRIWDALWGAGWPDRLEDCLSQISIARPEVVDLVGYSRGADECYRLSHALRKRDIFVRCMILYEPVDAHGLRGLRRALDLFGRPTPRERPPAAYVAVAYASDEYSPLLRHYSVLDADFGDYFPGQHEDVGRSEVCCRWGLKHLLVGTGGALRVGIPVE